MKALSGLGIQCAAPALLLALSVATTHASDARKPGAPNCGTHWTGWSDIRDPKFNPCPTGCEPGEKTGERRHKQGEVTLVDNQYRCYGVPTARTDGVQNRPVRDARPPAKAAGTVSPASGRWNSFVTLTGPGFGKAERVAVVWFPNDDDTKPQAGSISATVRKRLGADGLEIEVPRGAGGPDGGIVRLMVFGSAQSQPLLAGRFQVESQDSAAAPAAPAGKLKVEPVSAEARTFSISPTTGLYESEVRIEGPGAGTATSVSLVFSPQSRGDVSFQVLNHNAIAIRIPHGAGSDGKPFTISLAGPRFAEPVTAGTFLTDRTPRITRILAMPSGRQLQPGQGTSVKVGETVEFHGVNLDLVRELLNGIGSGAGDGAGLSSGFRFSTAHRLYYSSYSTVRWRCEETTSSGFYWSFHQPRYTSGVPSTGFEALQNHPAEKYRRGGPLYIDNRSFVFFWGPQDYIRCNR